MNLFNNCSPYFVKSPDELFDVIISWGKNEEQEIADTAAGIARIGGERRPDYHRAYLKSAAILIRYGQQYNNLDEIGLPAFYMQRHALELLIKNTLSLIYSYSDLINDKDNILFKEQKKRYEHCHDLRALLDDLYTMCKHFEFSEPPVELDSLVQKFISYEKSNTWSRYAHSEKKKKKIYHLKDETVLPIVDLQQELEKIAILIQYRCDGEEAFENELWYAYDDITGHE